MAISGGRGVIGCADSRRHSVAVAAPDRAGLRLLRRDLKAVRTPGGACGRPRAVHHPTIVGRTTPWIAHFVSKDNLYRS